MDLTFINGTLEGKSLNFNDSLLTIGRSYTNILMLNDDDVSSRHAFIELLDKRWVLFDNGSLNGVLLNNNKIEDNSELFDGDIVRIGKVRFTVSLGEKKKRPKESVRGRLNSTISQTLGIKHLSKRKSKLLKGKAQNGAKELRQERLERLRKKKATLKTRHRYTIATMLIFTAICFNLFYPDFVEASLERQHHFSNSAFKAAPRQLIVQQAKQAPLPVKRVIPATIFISSFPNDAFVELDGKNIGTTPVNLQEIPPGIHTLTISKEGFIPQQRTVKLPGKIMHNFNLMLEDYSALIRSTPPGAAVLIGGQLRGHTPLLLKDLSSGATSITLQAPGFRKLEHQISISETKLHTKVHLHLESNLGAMRIVTLPPGCQIFFNKQKKTSTTRKNDNAVSDEILLEKLNP
ncbi:MAG: PEGA domain-containing protein, partial [Lentisphaeraceae bacterium]|nr:PEGA domain-containing protein [Lentisphaeraceae bacterium]